MFALFVCVLEVVCDALCHHDTVLPYSQGQAFIIAASDSIMIQFYLLHRGQEAQEGTLEMDNLLHCQEMFASSSFILDKHTHTLLQTLRVCRKPKQTSEAVSSPSFQTEGNVYFPFFSSVMSHWVAAPLTL